jgi:hypothetical protein
LEGRVRALIGIGGSKESMRGMVAEVNAAQFPDKLIDVEIAAEMAAIDGLANQAREQIAPFFFHGQDLIAHRAFDIIELEQSCGNGTSAGEPAALRPSEPALDQGLKARKPLGRGHRRPNHVNLGEIGHVAEQADLHVLFRAEMREQAAFGHADPAGEDAQGNSRESGLAHEPEALFEDTIVG